MFKIALLILLTGIKEIDDMTESSFPENTFDVGISFIYRILVKFMYVAFSPLWIPICLIGYYLQHKN